MKKAFTKLLKQKGLFEKFFLEHYRYWGGVYGVVDRITADQDPQEYLSGAFLFSGTPDADKWIDTNRAWKQIVQETYAIRDLAPKILQLVHKYNDQDLETAFAFEYRHDTDCLEVCAYRSGICVGIIDTMHTKPDVKTFEREMLKYLTNEDTEQKA